MIYPKKLTTEQDEEIVAKYLTDETTGVVSLAAEYGVGETLVWRTLKRYGVVLRPAGKNTSAGFKKAAALYTSRRKEAARRWEAKESVRSISEALQIPSHKVVILLSRMYPSDTRLIDVIGKMLASRSVPYQEISSLGRILKPVGVCPICHRKQKLVLDHCHASDIGRGLICSACNTGLGMFQDDVDRIKRAIAYLKRQ